METREAYDTSDEERRATAPGIVLLFAAKHAAMAPAYPFHKDEVVVGREAPCDVILPDEAVSRRHASFVRTDGAFHLVDHGSRNGSLVDGVRVTRTRLQHRCRVRLGDAVFVFVDSSAEDYVPYAIDGVVRGAPPDDVGEMVGGLRIRTVAREIGRIAPTNLTCLVRGETGTGKELVARAIHRLSRRPGALQTINCAAIPAQLFESELFGYKRGAFSGADRDKPGLVHGAHEGTLFLDEIGDMPLEMQAKLLRLLQSREVLPVGAPRVETVDVRVVAATHRDLEERVAAGQFRGDLLARIEEHAFVVPPLRDRKEDVYMLASSFMRKHAKRPVALTFDVMDALLAYDWPFNVRELESCIKRAVALADGEAITRKHLPPQVLRTLTSPALREEKEEKKETTEPRSGVRPPPSEDDEEGFHRGAPKESYLRQLLSDHGGNIAAVARALGKRRMQVQRMMQKYEIAPSDYRKGAPAAPDDIDDSE